MSDDSKTTHESATEADERDLELTEETAEDVKGGGGGHWAGAPVKKPEGGGHWSG